MILVKIYLRGLWLVSWVSFNVHNVAEGNYPMAFASGFMISLNWWFNAQAASRIEHNLGAFAYGLGAATGTVLGMWVGGKL